MPLDHYVTLGRSGVRVSPFALGAMTFGEDAGEAGTTVEESEQILSAYLERGGNFIDTANFYTNGHSEKILGDYFVKRPGQRDHVILASKFLTNMYPGDPNGGGAGRSSISAALHQSLRRLQTDHLDVYWLHNWDRNTRSRRRCPGRPRPRRQHSLRRVLQHTRLGHRHRADDRAAAQTTALLRGWTPLIALQETVVPIPRARRLEHLTDDLAALDVTLSAEQLSTLDDVSAPTLTTRPRCMGRAPCSRRKARHTGRR
jgi:aryl-alcohol dehydrogenase (NADP+)